jgi:hypothetical protein
MIRLFNKLVMTCAMIAAVAISPRHSKAGLIEPGTTVLYGTAIQDITLYVDPSNLQALPSPVTVHVSGHGSIVLHRDAETAGNSIPVHFEGGAFSGFDPLLGFFVFGNVGKLTGADFTGSIDNVVQDPADPGFATGQESSFVSGDFHLGGASFGFTFLSLGGLTLYTDPSVPFEFSSTIYGLPPAPFTLTNFGSDVLPVRLGPNPYGLPENTLLAESSNRTIVLSSVPEPSSMALLGLGAIGMAMLSIRSGRYREESK